jgi:hypothetical protein
MKGLFWKKLGLFVRPLIARVISHPVVRTASVEATRFEQN